MNQKLAEAVEALEDGFVLFDHEDKLVVSNHAFRDQFKDADGIADKFVPGVTYHDMTMALAKSGIVPGIEGKEQEFVDQLIEKRQSELGLEKVFQTHDGRWIKQRDKRTESNGIVGVRIDVTELKETEEELSRREDMLASVLSASENGILVTNGYNEVMSSNARALRYLGFTEEEAKPGTQYRELLESQYRKNAYSAIEKHNQSLDNFVEAAMKISKDAVSEFKNLYMTDGSTLRYRVRELENGLLVHSFIDITVERNRELEIRKASSLVNETTKAMAQGLIVFEEDKIAFFNDQVAEILELPDDILFIGQTFENYLQMQKEQGYFGDQEVGEEFFRRHTEIRAESKTYQLERRTKGGKYVRVDGVLNAEISYRTLTFTDITDFKEQQNSLEAAKAEAETMSAIQAASANTMVQGLLFFQDSKLAFHNPKFFDLVGATQDQVYDGMPLDEILEILAELGDFEDSDACDSYKQEMSSNFENHESYQLIRHMKNGKILQVDAIARENGGQVVTYSDITESKHREVELEAAKSEAERAHDMQITTANAMANGLIVFQNEKLVIANERARAMLELPENLMALGTSLEGFFDWQRDQGYYGEGQVGTDFHDEILTKHRSGIDYQVERTTKSGKTLLVDGVSDGQGKLILTFNDISEIKKREVEIEEARKEAESAERAKSEFLANMSHEIRTPMNGVMGMAELLATTELDAKQKMFTDVIVKSGASLLTIINDILDFSKIDAGQMELDPAPFNLSEAIEDVATLVSAKVAEKDLELIVRVDPQLPVTLIGDVGRIRQVITNLMGNAVKFTEKGHIYVNVEGRLGENSQAGLKFEVKDTGIGIPEEKRAQVFKKFNQVDTSATRKHEGTGLGLSIASSLVNLMGGEIHVESEVGAGSNFWFEIDLLAESNAPRKAQVIPTDLSGSKVIVIDDNEVNRSILTEQLTAWQFDSMTAASGSEGLKLIDMILKQGVTPDLIILDYQMPVMSGDEVVEQLKANPGTRNIPVVMLTSVDSSESNRRLNRLGVAANLIKPTRSSLLLETILQVIANARLQAETKSTSSIPSSAQQPQSKTENIDPDGSIEHAADDGADSTSLDRDIVELDVLVAEDNEVNQIVFTQILEATDLNFKIVDNGRLALEAYKIRQPKLVLMDVSMPEMNGKEATHAIRAFEKTQQIVRTPIVGVTAHALKGDMESCLDAGMDDYLSKPVSPDSLVLKIEQWLKKDLSAARTA